MFLRARELGCHVVAAVLPCAIALANDPPAMPVITEPHMDGQVVSGADVHMETGPFSDPDVGDAHRCTSWEIWRANPAERVWSAYCVDGLSRVHIHLGDGVFENSHYGRRALLPETAYRLRVQHRDDSFSANEWSAWSERQFTTSSGNVIFPLEIDDVVETPPPGWTQASGPAVVLPGGTNPASLQVLAAGGDLFLEMRGHDGGPNLIVNPPPLDGHSPIRLRIFGGTIPGGLTLPASDLRIFDDEHAARTIYLPAIQLAAGAAMDFWVSQAGATYHGNPGQSQPDFSSLARGAPVPWSVRDPHFHVEVVASGFQLPVTIAFVPNPSNSPEAPLYYVAELYGRIKVVRRNGQIGTYVQGLLNFNPTGDFPGSGEQGLVGLLVDPPTGDLFASLLYANPAPDGPHFAKVIRLHSNDGGLTAANQTTLLEMPNDPQGQAHQISNLSLGPDGKLYVHMGDGFDGIAAPDLGFFLGKILRMEKSGAACADNPFFDASDGITARDYVFASGFRNPFGGAWRASDGFLYEVENGPSIDRFAKVLRGQNYLWDGNENNMRFGALYIWEPAHAPVNLVFLEPQRFNGCGFPPAAMDRAFVSESGPTWATGFQPNGKRIVEFGLDANGGLLEGPRDLVVYQGEGKASCIALAAGPDGLYFSDFYPDAAFNDPTEPSANILRVRYLGEADFAADVVAGVAPLAVQFTDRSMVGVGSTWHWDFGDGQSSAESNPRHVYQSAGTFDVRLTVNMPGGSTTRLQAALIRVEPGSGNQNANNSNSLDNSNASANANSDSGGNENAGVGAENSNDAGANSNGINPGNDNTEQGQTDDNSNGANGEIEEERSTPAAADELTAQCGAGACGAGTLTGLLLTFAGLGRLKGSRQRSLRSKN